MFPALHELPGLVAGGSFLCGVWTVVLLLVLASLTGVHGSFLDDIVADALSGCTFPTGQVLCEGGVAVQM